MIGSMRKKRSAALLAMQNIAQKPGEPRATSRQLRHSRVSVWGGTVILMKSSVRVLDGICAGWKCLGFLDISVNHEDKDGRENLEGQRDVIKTGGVGHSLSWVQGDPSGWVIVK